MIAIYTIAGLLICFQLALGISRFMNADYGRAMMNFIGHFMGLLGIVAIAVMGLDPNHTVSAASTEESEISKVLFYILVSFGVFVEIVAFVMFAWCVFALRTSSSQTAAKG